MDTCIAIRTLIGRGKNRERPGRRRHRRGFRSAREYQETMNKARAVLSRLSRRRPDRPPPPRPSRETVPGPDWLSTGEGGKEERTKEAYDRSNRQLQFVHLQPRPIPGRAGRGARSVPQRPGDGGADRGASPHASGDQPGPGTPADAGISGEAIRILPAAGSPSSACASATNAWARPSAGRSAARRGSCTAKPRASTTPAKESSPACPRPSRPGDITR